MSYTPGTKLSHTDATRRATVLTGDNVMVTGGLGYGQMMKLADWIILADGAKIQEEFIPVPKDGAAHSTSGSEFIPTPAAAPHPPTEIISPESETARVNRWRWRRGLRSLPVASAASLPTASAAPPPAIGTKFRWTLGPETYRVAIMTAKGVLQVKSVTDGAGEVHPTTCRECRPCKELAMTPPAPWARRPLKKTLFADEATWRASLPTGGSVEITPPAKPVAEQKVAVVAQAPNDVEKLKAAIKTYKIRTTTLVGNSPQEQLKRLDEAIVKRREELAAITLEQDLQWPHVRNKLTRQLKNTVQLYYSMKSACKGPNSHVKPVNMSHRGTGFIVGVMGGALHYLTVHEDQIAASSWLHYGNVRLYKNFAEMGGDLKIVVKYRGREITL
jgi:hypothetical protein